MVAYWFMRLFFKNIVHEINVAGLSLFEIN